VLSLAFWRLEASSRVLVDNGHNYPLGIQMTASASEVNKRRGRKAELQGSFA